MNVRGNYSPVNDVHRVRFGPEQPFWIEPNLEYVNYNPAGKPRLAEVRISSLPPGSS